MNQKELAEKSGVPAAVISRLRNGKRLGNVSARILVDLARALEQPVGWLVAGEIPHGRVTVALDPTLPDPVREFLRAEIELRLAARDAQSLAGSSDEVERSDDDSDR